MTHDLAPVHDRLNAILACFNFTKVDEGLFRELAALTDRSIEREPAITAAALRMAPRR